MGAGVRRIEGAALREKLPLLRDAAVAALEENHAYDIDVDALHGYFLRRHRAHGGLLRCTAPVSAITRSGGLWAVTAGARPSTRRP